MNQIGQKFSQNVQDQSITTRWVAEMYFLFFNENKMSQIGQKFSQNVNIIQKQNVL